MLKERFRMGIYEEVINLRRLYPIFPFLVFSSTVAVKKEAIVASKVLDVVNQTNNNKTDGR